MNSGKIQGYIFATIEDIEFANAEVGDHIVKADKTPPFFVVDHFIHKKILTHWPGKLYKVEILNENDDDEKEINKGLQENRWYTRTFGVKIIEELPQALLFGQNGEDICKIVDIATNITADEAALLSKYPIGNNGKLYSKVWNLWADLTDKDYINKSSNWDGTLAAYPKDQKFISPISHATSLVYNLCYKRAKALEGDAAIDIDDEGEISLKPKWSITCNHLLNAAMSYEAYGFLNEDEKLQMRKPIFEVFKE